MRRPPLAEFEVVLTSVLLFGRVLFARVLFAISKINCCVLTETKCVLLVILEEQLIVNAIPKPKDTSFH